jgi:hypothetical protein
MRSLLLFLFLMISVASAAPLIVSNPFRDLIIFSYTLNFIDFAAAFWNSIWGIFVAPWVGGNKMVQAQVDYNKNPGLHNFLGYTPHDFYLFRMQDSKLGYANSMGYSESILAPYTDNLPEYPPE